MSDYITHSETSTKIANYIQAPAWAASTNYKAGQLVWQNSILMRSKIDFTSGATFSSVNWDVIGSIVSIRSVSGTTDTVAATDVGGAIEYTSSTAVTVTVPTNANAAMSIGSLIEVVQCGTGQLTISPASGVTIRSSSTLTSRAQWSTLSLRKRATDEWILAGDSS